MSGDFQQARLIVVTDGAAGVLRLAQEANATLQARPEAEVFENLTQHLDLSIDGPCAQSRYLSLLLQLGNVLSANIADEAVRKVLA